MTSPGVKRIDRIRILKVMKKCIITVFCDDSVGYLSVHVLPKEFVIILITYQSNARCLSVPFE